MTDLLAPVQFANVEHAVQCERGGIGLQHVRTQATKEIFLAVTDVPSALHQFAPILEQPCQFRDRPASGNGHARDASVPLGRDALREHALDLFRPAIVPEHSWCERMLSLIK